MKLQLIATSPMPRDSTELQTLLMNCDPILFRDLCTTKEISSPSKIKAPGDILLSPLLYSMTVTEPSKQTRDPVYSEAADSEYSYMAGQLQDILPLFTLLYALL